LTQQSLRRLSGQSCGPVAIFSYSAKNGDQLGQVAASLRNRLASTYVVLQIATMPLDSGLVTIYQLQKCWGTGTYQPSRFMPKAA
jgi:hypothetical protein